MDKGGIGMSEDNQTEEVVLPQEKEGTAEANPQEEPIIKDIRNPRWSNAAQTAIDVEVNFTKLPEEYVQFTATPDDCTAYGPEIFTLALQGQFGPIKPYTPPQPADEPGA